MEADAPTGGAVKSLSPVVTIQETANEADSDSSPGPRTPETEVSPRDEGGRQGRQEASSLRGRIRPGTGRRSASRRLNKDATDARESGRGLEGVRKESPEAESPVGAGRPAARESFLDEVCSDGGDGDGEQPSPAEEAEYGSPTRPKPPRTHFEKPSSQRMAELDRHVLTTPEQLGSFPAFQLVEYLLRPTLTEVETAYALYRWVTCLRVKQGQTTSEAETKKAEEEGDSERVVPTLKTHIDQLKRGKIDHADLFSLLCKCANLESHKVTGKVRYYCPQPSLQLCRSRPASWSSVLLPGGWGLLDCALGARAWAASCPLPGPQGPGAKRRPHHGEQHGENDACAEPEVSGSGGNSRSVPAGSREPGVSHARVASGVNARGSSEGSDSAHARKRRECAPRNFYFLPSPERLVTSHLPDSPCWQLLPHPLSEVDFLAALLLKPHLYHLDVDLVSPTSLRVADIAEETDVTWRLRGNSLRRFAFRLFCVSDSGLSREDLTRYGFLENHPAKSQATLRLIPPSSGRYVCELYGTYLSSSRGNEMTHMCSFDLEFVKTITTPLQFPHNERVEWGPGAECVALGMRPVSQGAGCVNVDGGETEVVFACSRPLLVTQKLLRAEVQGPGPEVPRSTLNFRDPKNRMRILLRIPEAGDYVLGVYAKEEESPGKCQLVCNYLVLCDSGTPDVVRPFPLLPFSKLGPTKAFSEFRITLTCPKRSCVVVAPFSGKVTFVFVTPDTVELSCDLHHIAPDGGVAGDAGDYVQHTCQSGESVFRARLPETGDYLFHLYGTAADGEGHKFLLYSALVECAVPNKDCLPLPRVLPDWRGRVQILAPLRKFLVLGAVTHFAVRAYKVKAVAIVSESGSQSFYREDEEEEGTEEEREDGRHGRIIDRNAADQELTEDTLRTGDNPSQEHDQNGSKEKSTTETGEDTENYILNSNETPTPNPNKNTDENRMANGDLNNEGSGDDMLTQTATEAIGDEKEEEEEEDGEDEWQVWKCSVKVNREDEGSGVKLCVKADATRSPMVCVAEFEVITERNMAAKLDHQHKVWMAAEENFKVRPDSGHRSHLDDEECQSAYFLDDDVYLSNPLGDENSDDSDNEISGQEEEDDEFDDEDDEEEDEDFDSDSEFEDTTSGSAGRSAKADRKGPAPDRAKVGFLEKEAKSSKPSNKTRRMMGNSQGQAEKEKAGGGPKKSSGGLARKERIAQMKRAFHPTLVYSKSQGTAAARADSKRPAAASQRNKAKGKGESDGLARRGGERGRREAPQTDPRSGLKREKMAQRKGDSSGNRGDKPAVNQATERSDDTDQDTHRSEKRKNADGSAVKSDDSRRQQRGTKERSLRRKLWNACQQRNREAIQRAVTRYTRGGYPPCPDLAAAERLLHLFELRDALVAALESKDMQAIREALTEVERHGYAGEMSVVCRRAHAFLSPHRVQSKLPVLVEADMRTLLEIRSYRCPPEVVHHVIVSMLLLMGVHEGLTKSWARCRRRLQVLGPQGIHQKMAKVKVDAIHPEIAARARVLLEQHSVAEAHSAGPGVLAIYKWAQGIIARVESIAELDEAYDDFNNDSEPPQPACKRRQREIFRHQVTTNINSNSTTANGNSSSSVETKSANIATKGKAASDSPRPGRGGGGKVSTDKPFPDKTKQGGKSDQRNLHENGWAAAGGDASPGRKAGPGAGKEKTSGGGFSTRRGEGLQNSSVENQGDSLGRKPGKHARDTSPDNAPPASPSKPKPGQGGTPTKSYKPLKTQEASGKSGAAVHQQQPQLDARNDRLVSKSNVSAADDGKTKAAHVSPSRPSAAHVSRGRHGSPERANKATTANGHCDDGRVVDRKPKTEDDRGRQPRPRVRPTEKLRALSPHKSPLFRPANKPKPNAVVARPRSTVTANRPKTTPVPVLQSTFFFASLIKNDQSDGEDNNNNNSVPVWFQNPKGAVAGHDFASAPAARSAGSRKRTGALTEIRLGDGVGAPHHHRHYTPNGRRSASEIATPDI